ncbi:MAG: DUF47 domain-containing protein [Methylocystaceae bacterium]
MRFKPKDHYFFDSFDQLARLLIEGTAALKDYVVNDGDPLPRLEKLNQLEAEGDNIFGAILDKLNTTFIIPFDREDIYELSKELNKILDHIQGTMEKIVLYKAGQPKDTSVREMVLLLESSVIEVKKAVGDLRQLNQNYQQVLASCDLIRQYENDGDHLYRQGLAQLFDTKDAIEIIKWKEILEHLESTLDYCQDVSYVLKGVAVKYV